MSRLKEYYRKKVKADLKEKFKHDNIMTVPKLAKIVFCMGVAEAAKDKNALQDCINELSLITGQAPIQSKARLSISNFKLRKDQVIGLKVTLRGNRMYDFMDRFCSLAAPRIRDFRGFPVKADGSGNYSIGLSSQEMFSELNLDKLKRLQGLSITFVTSATNDDECIELLRQLGFPFKGMPVEVSAWN